MRARVVALVVVQVALPASMLLARWTQEGSRPTTERPASWQMYSFVPPAAYDGVLADGSSRRLSVDGLPVLVRAVDTGRTVPDRLCGRSPELVAVVRTGGADPGRFAC